MTFIVKIIVQLFVCHLLTLFLSLFTDFDLLLSVLFLHEVSLHHHKFNGFMIDCVLGVVGI